MAQIILQKWALIFEGVSAHLRKTHFANVRFEKKVYFMNKMLHCHLLTLSCGSRNRP